MLLSKLAGEIDAAAERFGEITVAIGTITGSWMAFSGISLGTEAGEAAAVLTAREIAYFRAPPVSSTELRKLIADFLADHGDMPVAIADRGMQNTFIDLNVDTDVDDAGDDVSVMVVQAYVMKASPKMVR
jgi:hypothetical protein